MNDYRGLDENNEIYGEETVRELESMMESMDNSLTDFRTSSWSVDQITKLGLVLDELNSQDEISTNDLWRLAVKLGRVSRKLDLTGSKATRSTLMHLYGTLSSCATIMDNGGTIHLIEGISSEGHQLLSDVDIMFSDANGVFQCDYTNDSTLDLGQFKIHDRESKDRKYSQLMATLCDGCQPLVFSYGIDQSMFSQPIIVPLYTEGPREGDFRYADHLIEKGRELHYDAVETMLKWYAKKMDLHVGDGSKMIETPGKYVSNHAIDDLIFHCDKNDVSSAFSHEMFVAELDSKRSDPALTKARIDHYYAIDQVKALNNSIGKRFIPVVTSERGMHHDDPFARLSEINKTLEKRGKMPNLLWKMVQHAKLDLIRGKEVANGMEIDYDYLQDCKIMRPNHKTGTPSKAVKLYFPSGKSFKGYQAYLKGLEAKTVSRPKTHVSLEEEFNEVWESSMRTSSSSIMMDEIYSMIPDVLTDNEPSDIVRGLMKRVMDEYKDTALFTQISTMTEITQSILNSARKNRSIKTKKGGVNSDVITLSLESVSDRAMVVMNNIGTLDISNLTDTSYIYTGLLGDANDYTQPIIGTSSKVLSMSHAQMDWNVTMLHKAISWASMNYENMMATKFKNEEPHIPRLPLYLMFLNNNKFSQAAEQVRYLVVNSISLSTGPKELFDKISWYTPSKKIELLYMHRMYKMVNTLNCAKANGKMDLLKEKVVTNFQDGPTKLMDISLREWKFAMPDEDISSRNEQQLFDSFYVCKALTIQRYQKLTSEALVILKQLESREAYLKTKSLELKHEGRFKLDTLDEDLLDVVLRSDFEVEDGTLFSPNPIVALLGSLATTLLLRQPNENYVYQTLNRVYGLQEVAWQMDISGVLNSRGSVRDVGKHGVSITGFVEKFEKDKSGKMMKKLIKVTQNAKCYQTILKAMEQMVKGVLPSRTCDWSQIDFETLEADLEIEYTELSKQPDKLWPLVYYFASNFAACVSKMVHKDQLGAREIAVLNAAARTMCRFAEMYARAIRDCEHKQGLKVNLIERRDKSEIIMQTLTHSNTQRKLGRNVMYDSADCSKFGPSMMPHQLYQTVGFRVKEPVHRQILRNCLALFGNKVFKIPDEFFLKSDEFLGDKDIRAKAKLALKTMSETVGSLKNQLIYLEESMHQGILGCSSSVLGSDSQNLSNYVTDYILRDVGLKTVSHLTSDDYSRVITWNKHTVGTYNIGKRSIALHYHILLHFGIKRNLQKSGLSADYWEFNSEFYCPTGEIRPDVKSRLSYIDYSAHSDPYPIAARSSTQASEFLRTEGSIVGASWTYLLNNHLAMMQNQSRSLYNLVGKMIYSLPLELGGLCRPDVLKCTTTSSIFHLLDNYKPTEECNLNSALAVMMDFEPDSPRLVSVDEDHDIKVPSLSRSGVVHLSKRPNRSTRQIREYLMSLDQREFIDAYKNRRHGSLTLALMASAKRETVEGGNSGSALNYTLTQTPNNVPLYLMNSKAMGIEGQKLTRVQLHKLAIEFNNIRHTFVDLRFEGVDVQAWQESWNLTMRKMKQMKCLNISYMPRRMIKKRFRQNYANDTFVTDRVLMFDVLNRPKSLGGASDLHAWQFIEAKILYHNRLSKLTVRRQNFRLALRDVDSECTTWMEKFFLSNTAGGCRLNYVLQRSEGIANQRHDLSSALMLNTDCKSNDEGVIVDLLSPQLPILLAGNRVKAIDITHFSNIMIGTDDDIVLELSQGQLLISRLKEISSKRMMKLVLNPRHMATTFVEKRFRSTQNVSMTQLPLYGPTRPAGRHLYVNIEGNYEHFYTMTTNTCPIADETNVDKNNVLDLTDKDFVYVDVSGLLGFTVLKGMGSRHLYQVFSQIDLKLHKVKVYCNHGLPDDFDLIRRLGLNKEVLETRGLDLLIHEAAQGYRDDDDWQSAQDSEAASDVESSNGLESDDESNLDSSVDFENDHIIRDESDSDDEYSDFGETDEVLQMMMQIDMEVTEGVDRDEVESNALDDDYQNEPEEDLSQFRPMSESGMLRPHKDVVLSQVRGSVTMLNRTTVLYANKMMRARFRAGYEVELPVDPGRPRYADEGGESGFELLIKDLEHLSEEDAGWAKSYLIRALSGFGPVFAVLDEINKAEMSSSDSDLDVSW